MAAVLGFVMAAFRLLAGALQFLLADQAAWGSVALFYTVALLNLVLAPCLVWGGIAALQGRRGDVLQYSALAVGLMEIFGLILAAANGGQTSRGAIALILAGVMYRNLRSAEAKQYFAMRSGADVQQARPPVAQPPQHETGPPPVHPPPVREPMLQPPAHPPTVREPESRPPMTPREIHSSATAPTEQQTHPPGGQPFGRYRLIDLVGRGGMGEVWRAFDSATNRMVAIKVLPPHLANDNNFVQRFRREADAAARLNNPHIIPIHTYGEIDGRLYVDMRLIEGRDLQSVLQDGAMEPARAVRIVEQVANALHAAHKIGLVHRDVKPSNILLDEDDFAYLIDFGIARGTEQTGLTNTGAVIGSWHYMAPERLGGRDVDARADIYALACVLYECLTGSRPFPGDNVESQIAAHLTAPPPRVSNTNPRLSTNVDAVIATGMAKEPGARFATTVDLAQAARDAVTQPLVATKRSKNARTTSPMGRRPVIAAVAAAVVVVVAVAAGVFFLGGHGNGGDSGNAPVFSGTFNVDYGPLLSPAGHPQGLGPQSELWHLRSVCATNGCVATATVDNSSLGTRVFDYVDGEWLSVANQPAKCKNRDGEGWNILAVKPQSDGTLTGEFVTANSMECYATSNVTFKKKGSADGASLRDPASQSRRVTSPAEALHGWYHSAATFTTRPGKTYEADFTVRTYCLRSGLRCISYFRNSIDGGESDPLVFSGSKWLLEKNFDWTPGGSCGPDAQAHTHGVREFPLPQPRQDPINALIGSGHWAVTGLACVEQQYDSGQTFERRGD